MQLSFPQKCPALISLATAAALLAASQGSAQAGVFTEPPGNFIPTYVGPHNPDLDVASFSASTNGTDLFLTGKLFGNVGTTPGAIYVFGIDTGNHLRNFASLGFPEVTFTQVAVVTTTGVDIGTSTLGALTISGDTINLDIKVSALPSTGFASPVDYEVDLWPRLGLGNNNQISVFAPSSDLAVPEPASIAIFGFSIAGFALFRRNSGAAGLSDENYPSFPLSRETLL